MASLTSLLHPNEPLPLGEVTGAIYKLEQDRPVTQKCFTFECSSEYAEKSY